MPDHALMKTIGMIAAGNPYEMIPYIRIILNLMMPLMGRIHDPKLKIATSFSK